MSNRGFAIVIKGLAVVGALAFLVAMIATARARHGPAQQQQPAATPELTLPPQPDAGAPRPKPPSKPAPRDWMLAPATKAGVVVPPPGLLQQ